MGNIPPQQSFTNLSADSDQSKQTTVGKMPVSVTLWQHRYDFGECCLVQNLRPCICVCLHDFLVALREKDCNMQMLWRNTCMHSSQEW